VGLHPEGVGDRHQEVALLEEYMKESRLVGEIGLDGSPQYRKSWKIQTEVLVRALKSAERLGGRVVSLHSRRGGGTEDDRSRLIRVSEYAKQVALRLMIGVFSFATAV
jgi:Tat protein secretion system quality control protein TatD with DNase activity